MFESLLCTTIGEEVPAVVFQFIGTFQAGITAEQIGVYAGAFRSVPVDIGAQVEVTALADVLIGRVEYVLACFFVFGEIGNIIFGYKTGNRLDAVVRKRIAGRYVDVELRRKVAVT